MKSRANIRKQALPTIAESNRTVARILDLLQQKDTFLLLGHEFPDEDCVASLVSMALIIHKCGKKVSLYLQNEIPGQLSFLAGICAYNKIPLLQGDDKPAEHPQVIGILDTPKPDMIALNSAISGYLASPDIPIFEFDHHLSADAQYSGRPGLCLVNRASSTCELIGFFCAKLSRRPDILATLGIRNLYSRNLVLSLLTGMIADTKFGITLKTDRDRFFYNYFTNRFASILRDSNYKNSGNYSSLTDIFKSIQLLTVNERDVYLRLLSHTKVLGKVAYIALDYENSHNYLTRLEPGLFVKVIKSVTDELCDKSEGIGLTAYYDMSETSDLIQFRIRTSKSITNIDLRTILTEFSITDGGGHPGAIGFRIPKNQVSDIHTYIIPLLERLNAL
ncbi:MAG: phosphoesterase [Spirochaetales bacterium]|nr:phosphoesterase [Spirochaetales bacterium]